MPVRRNKRSEKGEAELMFFGIVLVICALISGSLMILNWIKETKEDRLREARDIKIARAKATPFSPRPDPDAYVAHCSKGGWTVLQTNYSCDVTPDSYGEIYLLPD